MSGRLPRDARRLSGAAILDAALLRLRLSHHSATTPHDAAAHSRGLRLYAVLSLWVLRT
ncbi:MAG: hypothetical protein ACE366_23890 [Bradymonadia bacterium]